MKALPVLLIALFFSSCQSSDDEQNPVNPDGAQLQFILEFDDQLPRLGNFGQEVGVAEGNAAQSPEMREVSLHYIELAPNALTPLNSGAIVYQGKETDAGGARAVDFDQADVVGNNALFSSINISDIPVGTYEWIRVSLTYQNYDIDYRLNAPPFINNEDFTGHLASFVGFNTYINNHTVADSTLAVRENKLQGYWAFETSLETQGVNYSRLFSGDGAGVTVVNPIADTSPVPAGSCVVTGRLREPLTITGNEAQDVELVLAFSINNSFEWIEIVRDGKFEPAIGERVVDMGLRGLHPYVRE